MSPWWALAAALPAVAGYLLGEAAGHRAARRIPGSLREGAQRLLWRAAALGFPLGASAPAPGAPERAVAPGDAAGELERFRFWLDEHWRRSEEERRRLAAVLAGLTEGIVLLDRYGRVLLTNDVARGLWPQLSPRLRGRYHIELFQDAACDRALSEALASGEARQAELALAGPPARHFRLRALPIRADQAPTLSPAAAEPRGTGAAGVLVVVEDVTRQKAVDQIRRDFVANVSHELQTPLTSVRGYAETLLGEEGLAAPERARFLGHILREADRMAGLVRDLLALAQLEAPRWADSEPVDLAALARAVASSEEARAGERGLRLQVEAGAPPLLVSGRPEELRRALANLVQNAIAYTAPGGDVRISVERRGGEAAVSVADTGAGIAAEALPRVFERFYRVDRGRSRETGGTGLGLAIVKHTAEGHGGRIEVESQVGRGSRFTLLLPQGPGLAGPPGAP